MLSNKSSENINSVESDVPDLLGLIEASELLRVHPNTMRKWDKKGILVAIRFGERGDRKYKRADILKLISSKYEKSE